MRRYGGVVAHAREQCEAKIREPLTLDLSLRGYTFGTTPISDMQCSRSADGEVCGVYLCDQHRRQVTTWHDGAEILRPRVDCTFARWGLRRHGKFVPESDLFPLLEES
jgi:hypothetical protein